MEIADFFAGDGHLYECPRCNNRQVVKAGRSSTGKQRYRCRCGRVFVVDPGVPKLIKALVDRMLTEGISPAVIARVFSGAVSKRWVYARRSERNNKKY